ncbi:STAS domain-containing protein [Actinomadura darangshiensis]|uniref:STAS domain-containing protein n=1 Tax=Actinomadura darangshiensis TaxID=705336 RepID=UPI00140E220E|nr:STAS domain-containing protein [Actinomadura darangshiensis]
MTFQTTDVIGGVLLVTLTGAIDASNSGWLSGRLTTAITGGPGAAGIVVDLTDVVFCDASGISVLVKALKLCRRGQGTLELAGAHGKVARVLCLTGVDRALPLHSDLESALHAIDRHRSASAQLPPRRSTPVPRPESGGGEGGDDSGAVDIAVRR